MSSKLDRRHFLQRSLMASFALGLGGRSGFARAPSPNEKLDLGIIGVANRGGDNLAAVSSENIVALCDVDDQYLDAALQRFPRAVRYNDFRKLLERNDLDAVVISTPDHTHAPAALMALEAGLHVYCEKPLTHTVAEARRVAEAARRRKRVTQLGTQIHAGQNYRRVVELIRGGAIGSVREVQVWLDSRASGGVRPTETPPVPPNLHYDLWLGPAPYRPYHPAYLPARWRRWWDFGNGSLGDFGCHYMDLPFWALDLKHPLSVAAEGPPVDPETTAAWLVVRYEFPARGTLPPVTLTWYDGGKRPELLESVLPSAAAQGEDAPRRPQWPSGVLFIGEKGRLLADYDRRLLLPEKEFAGFVPPEPSIPDSIGHHKEWIEACKSGGPTTCHFDYAGPLTEAVLLGNVAYRAGQKMQWEAERLKARNCPEADRYLQKQYRVGWGL
jgi:predicted dehydrogenase